jgi:hypothetical protein
MNPAWASLCSHILDLLRLQDEQQASRRGDPYQGIRGEPLLIHQLPTFMKLVRSSVGVADLG